MHQPRRRSGKYGIIALTPRSTEWPSRSAGSNKSRLKMTTPEKMRELADRLLAYEAGATKTSEPIDSPTRRVYEKLRQSLVAFAGSTGFQLLAARALVLARPEAPSLDKARVTADGYLEGLDEFEPQINMDKSRAGKHQAGEGGAILIARLLGLLLTFSGEALVLSLLRNAWPGEAFDDRNSENGRKA